MSLTPNERRQRIEDLFRQYGRGVGSYILARVGNADLAETITSNVFLIVVRRIEQCRSSPAAWLWSIVRSELARHFRQHRPTVALEETYPDPAPMPPDVVARRELQTRMRLALEQLNEEQQRIIYLKFFLDVPHAEIAEELKLGISNVGVIIHRAIKQLRQLMDAADGVQRYTKAARTQGDQRATATPLGQREGVSKIFHSLMFISTGSFLAAHVFRSFIALTH